MAETLERDLASPSFAHGVDQRHWRLIEQQEEMLWVEFTAIDGTFYLMRLDCQGYGDQPIGGRFVDPQTRQCVESAWPRGESTFQQWVKFTGDLFLCWDQDRFGISHHPEWNHRKAWTTATPNQLVAYLTFIARLLNSPSMGYQPRP